MFFNTGASFYADSKVRQCQVRGQEQHSHGDGGWEALGCILSNELLQETQWGKSY